MVLFATLPLEMAFADSTPIILLSCEQNDEDIAVDVTLHNNENIFSMLLTLDYDRERIKFVGFEKGDALAALDLQSTNADTEEGYSIYPFKFHWLGEKNDNSNGKILTLHFSVVNEDVEGNAYVTFLYGRDKGATYIDENGESQSRNLAIDSLDIKISKGKVTEVTNEIKSEPVAKKRNTALIVGLSLTAAVLVALGVGLPLLWRKKIK